MKNIVLTLILITSVSILISAQSYLKSNSVFLGGMAGVATVNLSGSGEQSPLSLAFGGSVGVPVPFVKNFFLYARTSYISQ